MTFNATSRRPSTRPVRFLRSVATRRDETGQAALVLVMSMVLVIGIGVTMLVQTTFVDQSVITGSALDHAAYRAFEAAVSDYLYTLNDDFEYPLCNSSNTPGSDTMTSHVWNNPLTTPPSFCKTVPPFRTWLPVQSQVPTGGIPEWYAIGNPSFTQPQPGGTSSLVESVQFVGAAGYSGDYHYQTGTVNFQTTDTFLTNLFWDNLQEDNPYQFEISDGTATITSGSSGWPTGGTFTLTWNGYTTGSIAYDASASTILTALQALSGWSRSSSASGGKLGTSPVTIQQPAPAPSLITLNSSLSGGSLAVEGDGCNFVDWNNQITDSAISGGTYQSVNSSSDEYLNPSTLQSSNCTSSVSDSPVFFVSGEQINGPIYSNDAIFVQNGQTPQFDWPITTADPYCLFVDPTTSGNSSKSNCDQILSSLESYYNCSPPNSNTNTTVCAALSSSLTTPSNSNVNVTPTPPPGPPANGYTIQPIPSVQTNTLVENLAATGGCVYAGPTYITFNKSTTTQPTMTVYSPYTTTSVTTSACGGSNGASSVQKSPQTIDTPGNGVIYVTDATTGCPTAPPLNSELEVPSSVYPSPSAPNGTAPGCRGDAIINGDIYGATTVDAQNNIVITGNLVYCGDPTQADPAPSCPDLDYNDTEGGANSSEPGFSYTAAAGTTPAYGTPIAPSYPSGSYESSSVLGLIANEFIEVNNPQNPGGSPSSAPACTTQTNSYVSGSSLSDPTDLRFCSMPSITIDAAVLALGQSFLVNSFTSAIPVVNSKNPINHNLYINGAVAQDYRGAVGYGTTGGYQKHYTWDWRLAFIGPPGYLSPGVNGNTSYWKLVTSKSPSGSSCGSALSLVAPLTQPSETLNCSAP